MRSWGDGGVGDPRTAKSLYPPMDCPRGCTSLGVL